MQGKMACMLFLKECNVLGERLLRSGKIRTGPIPLGQPRGFWYIQDMMKTPKPWVANLTSLKKKNKKDEEVDILNKQLKKRQKMLMKNK